MPAADTVRVVFFDIDGTLVSFRTHRIPDSTLDAVAALRRRGIKVYIATGRPLPFIDNLGELEFDGMITATGAHCFARSGEVICHHPLSVESVERVAAFLQRGEGVFPVIFVSEDDVFVSAVNDEVVQVARLLNIGVPPVKPLSALDGRRVLQMISFFGAEREEELMSALMPDCTSMRWHPSFTDVIAGGVSKSAGIDSVLAYEGIPLSAAMAFGDGGNDLPMLKHVPAGVAMGNACDALKAVSRYVTSSVDEDGVARALRHFGLI